MKIPALVAALVMSTASPTCRRRQPAVFPRPISCGSAFIIIRKPGRRTSGRATSPTSKRCTWNLSTWASSPGRSWSRRKASFDFCLAGPQHPALRRTGIESGSLHAQPHPARLADAGTSGSAAWWTPPGRRMLHGTRQQACWTFGHLPGIRRQNRGRTRQALWQRPARLGLAARQRTQPLRQGTVLLRRLPGEIPRWLKNKYGTIET